MVKVETTGPSEWVRAAMERFEKPLLQYATGFNRDGATAQDVVQETFIRLCRQDQAELESRLAPWLFRVCRNLLLDHQRKYKRMTELTESHLGSRVAEDPGPSEALARSEERDTLASLLETLPPNQREVVRLKFQADLSYKEISDVTNLSVTNVGFLLHTAIRSLRTRWNSAHQTPSLDERNPS